MEEEQKETEKLRLDGDGNVLNLIIIEATADPYSHPRYLGSCMSLLSISHGFCCGTQHNWRRERFGELGRQLSPPDSSLQSNGKTATTLEFKILRVMPELISKHGGIQEVNNIPDPGASGGIEVGGVVHELGDVDCLKSAFDVRMLIKKRISWSASEANLRYHASRTLWCQSVSRTGVCCTSQRIVLGSLGIYGSGDEPVEVR